uniref:Alpha-1,6-mannosyl-glycoprotein 2-beta-N-acetylglucosaminyltransferase n=1 Tax=Glossina austeni TaxID=7395 RepID=A0A1A9UF98_GLOAU
MRISLSNTGSTDRNRGIYYMRRITFVAVWIFLLLKLQRFFVQPIYSVDAMRSVALPERDFLTTKLRNDPRINHQIAEYNDWELVLNEDLFGPLDNDSVVIVIQVHARITYLRYLIRSLARAYGISRVLLIFSHDYYDKDINNLVETINFCVVMQRYAEVEVRPWNVKNNMAFAFNRTTWNNIRTCAKHFCSYADYNYDQSFEYMSRQCPKGKLIGMTVKKTRVFHTGACSTHAGPCKRYKLMSKVQDALRIADKSSAMFPSDLNLTGAWLNYSTHFYTRMRGWDTKGDNELCMSMISPARIISRKRAKVK